MADLRSPSQERFVGRLLLADFRARRKVGVKAGRRAGCGPGGPPHKPPSPTWSIPDASVFVWTLLVFPAVVTLAWALSQNIPARRPVAGPERVTLLVTFGLQARSVEKWDG